MENKQKNEDINFFKDINLTEIFNEEEVENFFKEVVGGEDNHNINSRKSFSEKNKILSVLVNRQLFILKILKLSIAKLKSYDETLLAKGLEWINGEIQESLAFKSDEKSFKNFEKLKNGNQEMQTLFNFINEYSQLNYNEKQDIKNMKQKKVNTTNSKHTPIPTTKNNYLSNYFSNDKNINFSDTIATIDNDSKYINFSEECISTIEDHTFNIHKLEESVGKENTLSTISCYIFISLGLYSMINYNYFENFILEVTKGYYRSNPYHNDLHAADVEQTCYLFLIFGNVKESIKLDDMDVLAFLISAIIHDYKHPGLNNNFLINTKNDIALIYNDQSILENYHVAESFRLIHSKKDCNIFSDLPIQQYKIIRKRIIECVISTDMTLHTKQCTYLKIKMESFGINHGDNVDKIMDGLDSVATFAIQQEFLNVLIHAADISNPTKPMNVYNEWIGKIMEEFWNQGDKEKNLKLPISFLCDRVTTNIPKAQLGFIENIVAPLINSVIEYFPGLNFLLKNLNDNKICLKKIIEEEAKTEADKIK